MPSRPMQRAERASTAVANGPAILETLKALQPTLIAAAKQSRPPVAAVSGPLLERFGKDVQGTLARQLIGLCVRAILFEAGYEVAHPGVRIKGDPVFLTGSVYRPRVDNADASEPDDVLERIVGSLTPDEARRAFRALLRHFPDLRDEADRNRSRKRSAKDSRS